MSLKFNTLVVVIAAVAVTSFRHYVPSDFDPTFINVLFFGVVILGFTVGFIKKRIVRKGSIEIDKSSEKGITPISHAYNGKEITEHNRKYLGLYLFFMVLIILLGCMHVFKLNPSITQVL